MTLVDGIRMFITLNSITLFFVCVIFFFVRRHMKHEENQRRLAKVDNPTKHL
jgi:cbb3-type cytochrome oxidase subunit 3